MPVFARQPHFSHAAKHPAAAPPPPPPAFSIPHGRSMATAGAPRSESRVTGSQSHYSHSWTGLLVLIRQVVLASQAWKLGPVPLRGRCQQSAGTGG